MKRHNDDGRPNQNDVNATSQDGEHSDLNIHHTFPPRKSPMKQGEHPDHHLPMSTVHTVSPNPEMPQTTLTDKNRKGPKVPFKGKNS